MVDNYPGVKLTFEGNVLKSSFYKTKEENLLTAQLALSLLTGYGYYDLFEFIDLTIGMSKFYHFGGTIEYFKSY